MDLNLPDRYELSSATPLGEGGMARVYPARDVLLDVPVALKVVRPELAREPAFQRRFDLEIRLSARVSHPRVVPLHDHGRTPDDLPYLGLAYADLGHLNKLRDDPPAWPELLRLTLELLDALAHLHARDVLHRDVKPSNVLLHRGDDDQPHVWLADLGLASLQSVASQAVGQQVGTPGYMAPEQAMGQPREAGPWTDLFSVGVILWELVTGELPYAPETSPDATPLPVLVPRLDVPRGLRTVLGNLLRPEPLGRYDLAADLATELRALGETDVPAGEAIEAPEPGIVAPGCPPLPPEADASDDAVDEPDDRSLLGLVDETKAVLPLYNRPFPSPLPETIPPRPRSARRPPASLQLWALREPVLLAREPQRQAIWDVARQIAHDGRGRVVFLVGDAGSGKSYLVEDVVRTLEAGGWAEAVRIGYHAGPTDRDGYAGAARQLLRPFNETQASLESRLRRRLARERESLDRPVAQEARDLARWCLPGDDAVVPAGIGLRELYRHLEARQWRGLSVMVIDDVHRAPPDDEGMAIPEALLQRWSETEPAPWLVLVTLGAEELAANPSLADRVDRAVEQGALRLVLEPLDESQTRMVLSDALRLTDELAERAWTLSGGNPQFARQLLLFWTEQDWLEDTGDFRYGLREDVAVDQAVPADAEAVFGLRVANLAAASGHAKRFLDTVHLVALAGQTVPRALVEAVAGAEMVSYVLGCGLFTSRGERVSFDGELLYQAVRKRAGDRDDLAYLHRRLARAWARIGEVPGAETDRLAGYHAMEAGDPAFALAPLLRASERAWHEGRAATLDQLTLLLLEAVEALDAPDPSEAWAALWRGRALDARGDPAGAAAQFLAARNRFEEREDAAGLTDALIGLGIAELDQGHVESADVLFADALARAKTHGLTTQEARGLAGKAWLEQKRHNFGGADILFGQVLDRFRETGDARGAGEALLGRAFVARRTGAFADARELYLEAETTFDEAGNPLGVAQARIGLATLARQQQQWDEAERLSREAVALAGELGAMHLRLEARYGLAELARWSGDLARAQALYEEHARAVRTLGRFEDGIFSSLGLALVALERDDLDTAYDQTRQAAARLDRFPGHFTWPIYRLVVATLLARRRDHTQTWQWLWSASELGLGDTVELDAARCLQTICTIAAEEGWANVIRVAGKLAVSQLEQLGLPDEAKAVQVDVDRTLS